MNQNEFRHKLRTDLNRPQLTPDIIDHFVTWLNNSGVNLYSFQISELSYKRDLFSRYWKQAPEDHKQIRMDFPD